jgi:hypothetical protein
MASERIPEKLSVWIKARTRFHLSRAQVKTARKLNLNPKKFGKRANRKQELWKMPLPQVIDHAFNPGGPLDFGGLTSGEMCEALFTLGQGPMLGLDLVEVYPLADLHGASVHLLV